LPFFPTLSGRRHYRNLKWAGWQFYLFSHLKLYLVLYRYLWGTILLLVFPLFAFSQAGTLPVAARYLGVFGYSARQVDVFATRYNPAALAGVTRSAAGAYGERRFMLEDLNLFEGTVGLATRSGTFGLNAQYFGFDLQNQTAFSLSYGRRVAKVVDVGASFYYHQFSQAGIYGNATAITGSIGLLMHLGNNVHAGLSAYNPFRAAWNNDKEARLPSRYGFGLGIDASEKVFVGTEIIKEENLPVDVQAAVHYSFLPQFFIRGGIATQNASFFTGIGFKLPAFRIDLAASYRQQLGWTPGVLLLANFGKSREEKEKATGE
jgi:hypothetical protein